MQMELNLLSGDFRAARLIEKALRDITPKDWPLPYSRIRSARFTAIGKPNEDGAVRWDSWVAEADLELHDCSAAVFETSLWAPFDAAHSTRWVSLPGILKFDKRARRWKVLPRHERAAA